MCGCVCFSAEPHPILLVCWQLPTSHTPENLFRSERISLSHRCFGRHREGVCVCVFYCAVLLTQRRHPPTGAESRAVFVVCGLARQPTLRQSLCCSVLSALGAPAEVRVCHKKTDPGAKHPNGTRNHILDPPEGCLALHCPFTAERLSPWYWPFTLHDSGLTRRATCSVYVPPQRWRCFACVSAACFKGQRGPQGVRQAGHARETRGDATATAGRPLT